jgi:hypothetical protein
MKASERLLNTEYSLVVFKMVNGKIGVHFENCEVKDECFLIGEFGRGNTFEEACENYLERLQGKTLVFNAYGNRKEVVLI